MGKMARTRALILRVLEKGPARTSEIRKIVVGQFPDAAVYGAMSALHCDGVIRRVTNERDAKWENKK
jgi:hypothetical protein